MLPIEEVLSFMEIETFNSSELLPPKRVFHIEGIGTKQRIKRVYDKLFNSCGGVDNLVFYPPDTPKKKGVVIQPVYVSNCLLQTHCVFKVVDINKVNDFYKTQVEVM